MNVIEEFDSDSSDEDYVPDGKVEEAGSEVESDGDPEDPGSASEEEQKSNSRKRTKKVSRTKKRAKVEQDNRTANEVDLGKPAASEEKKQSVDDLWADFMKDTGFKPKNDRGGSSSQSKIQQSLKKPHSKKEEKIEQPLSKVKITQIFEFAGEEVKVEKEVDANSAEARLLNEEKAETSRPRKAGGLSGIGSVLSQLGKKQKISTLEKTKLDWDRFKKDEDIEEELQVYNKGKDGYLERQDFLQRADLRRFEIEKNIRDVERAKRFNTSAL